MNPITYLFGTTALTTTLLLGGQAAYAGVLSESNSYTNAIATSYTGSTIGLQGFDAVAAANSVSTSAVTLQSVKVTVTDTITGTATAVYTGVSSTFFFNDVFDVLRTTTAPTGLNLPALTVSSSGGVGSAGSPLTIGTSQAGVGGGYNAAGTSYTSSVLSGSGSKNQTVTGAALSSYLSNWSMVFSETGSDLGGSGTGVSLSASTQGNVTVSVVYTYADNTTPAPEPTSIALLATALTGVGIIRRRRRKV